MVGNFCFRVNGELSAQDIAPSQYISRAIDTARRSAERPLPFTAGPRVTRPDLENFCHV
jgi:hypothetical protein